MLMVFCPKHPPPFLLRTHLAVLHPLVLQDFFKRSALRRVDLQHSANNVPSFTWQQTQQSPWALDNLRLLWLLWLSALTIFRFRTILVGYGIRMTAILSVVMVVSARLARRCTRRRLRLNT
jgi:hypothetical protein